MKDNTLLVDFESVVDLDFALFEYFRDNYYNSDLIDKELFSIEDDREIKYRLLSRQYINPLELFMPTQDPKDIIDLYYDILNTKMGDLLSVAKAYDTFPLLITFLKNASSVDIYVRCDTKQQEDFILSLNPIINTLIQPRDKVDLDKYTVFWEKYLAYCLKYDDLECKHIYVAQAQYNLEPDVPCVDMSIAGVLGQSNLIHTMDLYTDVKYIPNFQEDNNEDQDLF